jgi:DNA-binding HxlR family transcriptional regulator
MARSYDQFCPMAAALDAVGERWALLVVRELVLGPRSFTQLATGLPGIGTDILTARLRSLEDVRVIERSGRGRRRDYALTADGHALRRVLAELARWGAPRLQPPASPEDVRTRTALTALLLDAPQLPPELDGHYEIQCGEDTARLIVAGGAMNFDPSAHTDANWVPTVIKLTTTGLRALITGTRTRSLLKSGDLAITGEQGRAAGLITTLAPPPLLAEALHARRLPSRT